MQGTPSPWLPALHITPCLAQGGDYGAAWKSVDYGEAACGPDRSPGWRAGIAGKPPGSDALYRSIDAIRPRHAEHITCLGPQSDIPAGRTILSSREGQTVNLIPAPEVDQGRQGELNMKHPSIRCPCGGNAA